MIFSTSPSCLQENYRERFFFWAKRLQETIVLRFDKKADWDRQFCMRHEVEDQFPPVYIHDTIAKSFWNFVDTNCSKIFRVSVYWKASHRLRISQLPNSWGWRSCARMMLCQLYLSLHGILYAFPISFGVAIWLPIAITISAFLQQFLFLLTFFFLSLSLCFVFFKSTIFDQFLENNSFYWSSY